MESEQKDECPQMWDTAKESVDKKQKKKLMNGFHTIWDAEFKEREQVKGRVALNKDVAFLKFSLIEVRKSVFSFIYLENTIIMTQL